MRLLVVRPAHWLRAAVMRVHEHFELGADELFVARDLNLALVFLQDARGGGSFLPRESHPASRAMAYLGAANT